MQSEKLIVCQTDGQVKSQTGRQEHYWIDIEPNKKTDIH